MNVVSEDKLDTANAIDRTTSYDHFVQFDYVVKLLSLVVSLRSPSEVDFGARHFLAEQRKLVDFPVNLRWSEREVRISLWLVGVRNFGSVIRRRLTIRAMCTRNMRKLISRGGSRNSCGWSMQELLRLYCLLHRL